MKKVFQSLTMWAKTLILVYILIGQVNGKGVVCPTPKDPYNGKVQVASNGLAAIYKCNNEENVIISLCVSGKWTDQAPECNENSNTRITDSILNNKTAFESLDVVEKQRIRRTPNNGKFQILRMDERVDQMVRKGRLETSIESGTPTIVRVHPDDTAYLMCRVKNLGTQSVMWSYKGKVLTIDTTVLSNDHRLYPSFDPLTGTWLLEVRPVFPRDAGEYECKVSSRKPLKHIVTLQVIPRNQPLLPTTNQGIVFS